MSTQPGSCCSDRPVPLKGIQAVVLVGFMGSGKTSVGQVLGQLLGWRFEDLDDRIEAREGRTIAAIFGEMGEAAFRQKEREALNELVGQLSSTPTVAALGGGAFVDGDNFALLENCGVLSIFLDAPVRTLWRRCQLGGRARPLRQNFQHFRNLYESRRESYKKARLYVNTSGKRIEAVAKEIAKRLALRPNPKEN